MRLRLSVSGPKSFPVILVRALLPSSLSDIPLRIETSHLEVPLPVVILFPQGQEEVGRQTF